jgi:exonuclease SbcC
MIPISLVIKGLYSYQEAQTIVFDRLIDGQLFGIFGSVGSGKSSILEAISFALYGETERLNQRDNRNYNMMNLKSDDLLIDFKFKNFDDIEYRFIVRGKRNGKDFTKVNTFDRSSYKYVNDAWLPLESTSAEAILGLSYENFRRTIIIPQGKFQEFLQLGDKARTDMLKEIFNLNKYEFFYQTASLERKNNDNLQNLKGQLSHYDNLIKEAIEVKENDVRQLKEDLDRKKLHLLEEEKLYQAQLKEKKLYDDRTSYQQQLDVLLEAGSDIERLDKMAHDYEYCQLHFKSKLERKQEVEISIKKQRSFLDESRQLLNGCSADLESLTKEQEGIEQEYKQQEKYKELAADYKHILSLIKIKADELRLKRRIEEGQMYVDSAAKERKAIEDRFTVLKAKVHELKASLPDLNILSGLRAWFFQNDHLDRLIKDLQDRLSELHEKRKGISSTIQQQFTHLLLRDIHVGSSPNYHRDQVLQLRKQYREKHQEVQGYIDQYNLQVKLGEFSRQLNDGEPCVLCGSIHHPNALQVDNALAHLKEANAQLDELRTIDEALERLLAELSQFIYEEKLVADQITSVQQQLEQGYSNRSEHQKAFIWTGYSTQDPKAVNSAFEKAYKTQEEIKLLEKELTDHESLLLQKNADYDKYRNAVNGFELQLLGKNTEFLTLRRQLLSQSFEDHEHMQEADIKLKIEELYTNIEAVKEQFEAFTEKHKDLTKQKITLSERINSSKQLLSESEQLLQKLEVELTNDLALSSYLSFEQIQSILRETIDLISIKKMVTDHKQQVFAIQQRLNQLQDVLGDRVFNEEQFLSLEAGLNELKTQLESTHLSYVRESELLKTNKQDYAKKILLEKDYEKLQHRASNINILKQLFKGSGFVSYISTVYLQNLCHAANTRFYKLTRQQLRLEVTDKNDFQVRDFLNNGKVRNVKTLSGGQTFQASLSLALALAESVQQQNKSNQNFFFLDEGFGSLDKESLQIAFETLKSLRKENRIVGIISHVEELQQEIDVFLNIVNDPFTGSKITGNWE